MHRQITIAELKPVFAAQAFDLLHKSPRFAGAAPAELLIVYTGQRIHHRVEVGANGKAHVLEIVTGVDDDGQLIGRQHCGQPDGKARTAHATRKCDDHRNRSSALGRITSAMALSRSA